MPIPMPLPQILGADGAGVVESVGAGVSSVRVGDEVIVTWVKGCGHCIACLRGEDHYCVRGGSLGIEHPGTYAQYVVVP